MTCSSALDGGRSYHAWAKTEKYLNVHVFITLNLSILHQSHGHHRLQWMNIADFSLLFTEQRGISVLQEI